MAKKKPKTEEEKRRAHRGESYRAVIVAVVAALVLRLFVIQLFKIPSKSMEPTLLGDPDHGDRVIAVKLWKSVQRWGIYVFKHKVLEGGREQEVDYIKRFVGLPGDYVLIRGGDFHTGGGLSIGARIERKPRAVQEDVWIRVYDGASVRSPRLFQKSWREREAGAWRYDGEAAEGPTLGADARKLAAPVRIEYRRPVTDQYIRAGRYPLVCPSCRERVTAWLDTAHPFAVCPKCREVFDAREEMLADSLIGGRDPLGLSDGGLWRLRCPYLDCRNEFRQHGDDFEPLAAGAAGAAGSDERGPRCPACGRSFRKGDELPLDALLRRVGLKLPEPARREVVVIPCSPSQEPEPVGDVRLSFDFLFEEGGALAAEIVRRARRGGGRQVFRLEMPLTESAASVRLTGPDGLDRTAQRTFVGGGGVHSLSFAYADGAVRAEVDGETLFDEVVATVGAPVERAGAAIEVTRGCVSIRSLALDRDLHYRAEMSIDCQWLQKFDDPLGGSYLVSVDSHGTLQPLLPEEYMPLGDDSAKSADARHWARPVREEKVVGRAVLLVWPLHRFRVLR